MIPPAHSAATAGHSAGFSLVELLAVLALLGILTATAYPAYTEQLRQSRRVEGMSALLELATRLEGYRADHGTYAGAALGAGALFRPPAAMATTASPSRRHRRPATVSAPRRRAATTSIATAAAHSPWIRWACAGRAMPADRRAAGARICICIPRDRGGPAWRMCAAQYELYGQALQHSRIGFQSQPYGIARLLHLAVLRLAHVATATPHSPCLARRRKSPRSRPRPRGIMR